jgi:predicted transcriptional regulator
MTNEEHPQVGTTTQTVRIEASLLRRLKIHAANTRQSQQDILYNALLEYLDRHEKGEPK